MHFSCLEYKNKSFYSCNKFYVIILCFKVTAYSQDVISKNWYKIMMFFHSLLSCQINKQTKNPESITIFTFLILFLILNFLENRLLWHLHLNLWFSIFLRKIYDYFSPLNSSNINNIIFSYILFFIHQKDFRNFLNFKNLLAFIFPN